MSECINLYCQVCGADSHRLRFVVENYKILKCDNCGVGRVDVNDFDPIEHYDKGYFNGNYKHSYRDYLGSEKTISREFGSLIKYIRSVGPRSGKLLELGSAYGFFLQQAKPYYDVHGVEIVAEAVEHCKKTGLLNVKHGVLDHADIDALGKIDVAVMLDVIEHIDNLEETFAMLASALRPGGTMFVTTGDWSSLVARVTGRNWRLMAPPLHLWYLNPKGLELLGRRFGLEVLSIDHPWKIVPLDLVIHQALVTLGWNADLKFPSFMKKVGVPANLGDSMRIVFTKR